MPAEDNKAAVRRCYQEVINGRTLDALEELLAPDGIDHTFGSQNPEQAKQFFGMVHQAFPDLHAEVHDLIAEGELVAARVTYTGTHQGEFLGIPATGKQTTTNGVDFFRMQDGRQAEHWGGPDMLSFLMQLGVIPRTRHARLAAVTSGSRPLSWVGHQRWAAPPPCLAIVQSRPTYRRSVAAAVGQGRVLGPLCAGNSGSSSDDHSDRG